MPCLEAESACGGSRVLVSLAMPGVLVSLARARIPCAVCRELEARDKDERQTQESCDTRDKKKKRRATKHDRQEKARRQTASRAT